MEDWNEVILGIALVALIAYLLGSLSFAVIISKVLEKDDVRTHGSGNAGMTNMLRTYGKGPAALTLIGDFSKGVVAVLVGRWIFEAMGITVLDAGQVAGLFALLGHIFPVFFHFKGGKGVLTSAGMIAVINPLVLLLLVIIVVPVIFLTRIVSVGSLLAAVLYPVLTAVVLYVQGLPVLGDTLFATAFGLIVIFMHRENIQRLIHGTENRFGGKKQK